MFPVRYLRSRAVPIPGRGLRTRGRVLASGMCGLQERHDDDLKRRAIVPNSNEQRQTDRIASVERKRYKKRAVEGDQPGDVPARASLLPKIPAAIPPRMPPNPMAPMRTPSSTSPRISTLFHEYYDERALHAADENEERKKRHEVSNERVRNHERDTFLELRYESPRRTHRGGPCAPLLWPCPIELRPPRWNVPRRRKTPGSCPQNPTITPPAAGPAMSRSCWSAY